MGDVLIALNEEKAPISSENFKQYVLDGFYNGTLFHRVIKGFMIQGGGMNEEMVTKPTRGTIENEAGNGLTNTKGSIAMARTSSPHSATSQFFINTADNDFLDFPSYDGWGYCVFGKVIEGMDVVEKIEAVQTTQRKGHMDVPVDPVVILRAEIQPDSASID